VFIRTTRNSAGQAYYHLVESYRSDGKVKQRTLLSLGRVEDGKLEKLAEAIAKHTDLLSALDIAKTIGVENTYVLGPLLVLRGLFAQLGIDAALERLERDHPKLEFSLREVVFALVAARFVRPASKLAVYEQMLERFYPDMLKPADLDLQHLYRALDVLNSGKDDLEKSLFMHGRDLFSSQVDVVLYDLTTLRFESTSVTEKLRRFGFSKEKRNDCTQVVLGLLVDPEGIPLGFEVYPGNTFEGKTLVDIVKKMREKFRVRRFIFVADRGLFSKANLKAIRSVEGEFIVGMRIGGLAKKRPELYDRSRFRKVNDGLEVLETTFGEDRGVVTWTRARALRDQKVRNDILEKLRTKLRGKKISAKTFVSNSNYRFFLKGLDKGQTPVLDEAKIVDVAKKDGFFAIVTNLRDKTGEELFAQYKELWRIEDAFGEFKGTLQARPVFHWKDRRIVGHLTMCFIALLCEAHVTRALRRANDDYDGRAVRDEIIETRPLSAVPVLRDLAEVRAIPVSVGNQKLWVRTDIKGHVAILFQRLGLRIPPRLLKRENVVAQDASNPVIHQNC
jgi:Transposase DDE domain